MNCIITRSVSVEPLEKLKERKTSTSAAYKVFLSAEIILLQEIMLKIIIFRNYFFKIIYTDFAPEKEQVLTILLLLLAPVQASFRLQRPVSLLTAYTSELESDILDEIGMPNTKVKCQDSAAVPLYNLS